MRLRKAWTSAAMASGVALLAAPSPAQAAVPAPEAPARPPLPPEVIPAPLPWEQHLEIGGDIGLLVRPLHQDATGAPTPVRLQPAFGYGIHLTWDVLSWLRFSAYSMYGRHPIELPTGSFGLTGAITSPTVHSYVFGARFEPVLQLTARARGWLSAGAGWSRYSFPRMTVTEDGHAPYSLPERSTFVLEVPLGIGASFEIIPRRLCVQLEVTGALLPVQQGDGLDPGQAIDWAGKKRTFGTAPRLDTSIVQTLGVALML